MKKLLISLSMIFCGVVGTMAQYHPLSVLYGPGNPGGVNTDIDFDPSTVSPPAGSVKIIGNSVKNIPLYSATQTIPFAFMFNGGPVTKFKASTSGYLTFAKVTPVAGNVPAALPSALLPD